MILPVVVVVFCVHSVICAPEAIQWIGRGYNVLYADPDLVGFGKSNSAPVDPGRTLFRVLRYTYFEQRMDFSKKIKLPDQVAYSPVRNCADSKSYSLYYGAKSYQKKLSQSVKISAGVPRLVSMAFTAGFSKENKESSSTHSAFFEGRSTCARGQAMYRRHSSATLVDADFAQAVCGLPKGNVRKLSKQYTDFFEYVGTHVITDITIGVGKLQRKTLSVESMAKLVAKSNTFGMSVAGGTPTIQIGASTNLEKAEVNSIESETKNQRASVFTIGTDEHPGVIHMELSNLYDFINKKFWTTSCKDPTFRGKRCCKDIDEIGSNVQAALNLYPLWLKLKRPKDPYLLLPVAWPLGYYGLPQTDKGCPDSKNFEWLTGARFQRVHSYTELEPASKFPKNSLVNLGGSKRKLIQQFCIKDSEQGSKYARDWPAGSYCMYSYGKSCPKPFKRGFVWWNDVGYELDPGKVGFVPDGEYDDNTKIFFCCRNDGMAATPVILPTSKPFYLLKKGQDCQRVLGMNIQETYMDADTQDFDLTTSVVDGAGNHPELEYKYATGAHIKMFYCYYSLEE